MRHVAKPTIKSTTIIARNGNNIIQRHANPSLPPYITKKANIRQQVRVVE
jgi:hypothetical protein